MGEEKKVNRRDYLKYTGAAIGGLVVGGALGYLLKPAEVIKETVTAPGVTATTTIEKTATITAPGVERTVTITATAPGTTVTVPPARPYEGVKITCLVHTGVQAGPWYAFKKDIKDLYGIELEVVEAPPEELYSKALLGLRSKPADYDIIQWDTAWIGDFEPYLQPLDDYLKTKDFGYGDILPAFRQFHDTWAGRVYGITLDGDTFMLYYRADLWENPEERANFKAKYGYELRAPRTWKEVMDMAEFFTRKSGEKLAGKKLLKDFYGYADQGKRGRVFRWYLHRWVPYNYAALGKRPDYFDPDTMKPMINNEPSIKALKDMGDILKYSPPGVLGFEWTELFTAAMKDSTIAIWIHWPDEGDRFADQLAPLPIESPPPPKLGFAPTPGVVGPDGQLYRATLIDTCWDMGIAKNSKNPDAAWAVVSFMARPDIALERAMAPTPKCPSSNHDPFAYSQYNSIRWRAEKPWVGPFLDAELEALKTGYPMLKMPGAFEYLDTLDRYISDYLAGVIKDPKEALDRTADEWEKITDRLGRSTQKEYYKKMWEIAIF